MVQNLLMILLFSVARTISDIQQDLEQIITPESYTTAFDKLNKEFIKKALQQSQGKIRAAARSLGISRNTLKRLLSKYELKNI
ncbi:helix-turn-helix domain-containing protein [candidate division CSSED10-310 bacterium]|uniref:Helix-turn-helix domain-containing protein n=1 Tax=candidate division CSSED10-310 bacterium TaxID=2855610 RepID=A0ABV6Z049_UNCC1